MKWRKLGRIFVPDGKIPWMKTHAAVPFADSISENLFKIYFSSRDVYNRSHIGWLLLNMNNPSAVIEFAKEPILSPGLIGTFDDSGVMATCILNVGTKKYLYYIGFNLGVTVPFRNSIGLAISEDAGETFNKFSEGPIIDRTYKEPHFTASISILLESGIFRAWYLSCIKWEVVNGKPKHFYHIKYAESNNGIDWTRNGIIAIDFKDSNEYAISVPRVIKEDGIYKMWYSYRGERYKIGYAESDDGIGWTRKDCEVDLPVSADGWDSSMIEYPYVFDYNKQRYMLYNGNDYGKTGFGLAILTS